MDIRVLYFASARDLATKSAETVSLPEGSSVADAARAIRKLHPRLGSLKNSAKFSVNFVLADEGLALKEGDEVGVLPPVAGG